MNILKKLLAKGYSTNSLGLPEDIFWTQEKRELVKTVFIAMGTAVFVTYCVNRILYNRN